MTKHYRNHNIRFNMTDEGGVQAWERLHSAEAVSYTHLDVYKRQFQNYALFRYMTIYDNVAFGLELQKMPKKLIKAVSYTHLDVYKRQ